MAIIIEEKRYVGEINIAVTVAIVAKKMRQ